MENVNNDKMSAEVLEIITLVKTSDSPLVHAALERGRYLDGKHGKNGDGRASFYTYVAAIAAREAGKHFSKGLRLQAGRLLSEELI